MNTLVGVGKINPPYLITGENSSLLIKSLKFLNSLLPKNCIASPFSVEGLFIL